MLMCLLYEVITFCSLFFRQKCVKNANLSQRCEKVPCWLFWGLTCLENTAMSSLKDSEEQTSPPATEGSRGVHVASSHFSKMRAKSGKSGCLQEKFQQN